MEPALLQTEELISHLRVLTALCITEIVILLRLNLRDSG